MKTLFCFFGLLISLPSVGLGKSVCPSSEEIHYVETVQSLNELLHMFEGKLIYIDFWAPWCSPCVKALEKAGQMNAYFEKYDIVRLYVSVEKNVTAEQKRLNKVRNWKQIINQHQVSGYHYYAELKTALFNEIVENFMRGKLTLPRYAIINKQGKVIDRNAPGMDKPDKLKPKFRTDLIFNGQNPWGI